MNNGRHLQWIQTVNSCCPSIIYDSCQIYQDTVKLYSCNGFLFLKALREKYGKSSHYSTSVLSLNIVSYI